jgi:hypothetical protein
MIKLKDKIEFPEYTGTRCLMMPYLQGDPDSVPEQYQNYRSILERVFIETGKIGFLTIDESPVVVGTPHRGARAKHGRALHTEAGINSDGVFGWGTVRTWGGRYETTLDEDVRVLLANSLSGSCALWNAIHENTSEDGDIGDHADQYPYENAVIMDAGDVYEIGILTPHESLPVKNNGFRQFLRIVSSGVHGRESYFTTNPLVPLE